jgi:hypothetical protein
MSVGSGAGFDGLMLSQKLISSSPHRSGANSYDHAFAHDDVVVIVRGDR